MLNIVFPANGEAMPHHRIERHIQALIDMLDAMDGDPDIEPDNAGTIGWWHDAEGDDADMESSLGWTDSIAQLGTGWSGEYDEHGLEREFDPADVAEWDEAERGIADQDGLAEQFGGVGYIVGVL